MVAVTLDRAPLNTALTVREAGGQPSSRRRLAALGIRRGAQLVLLQATAGGGRLALVAGSRIALGADVLKHLRADVTERA